MPMQSNLFETKPLPRNQYGYAIEDGQGGGTESPSPGARARKKDPATSHIAARKIECSGVAKTHRDLIRIALRRRDGQTGHELAAKTGLNQVEVVRRLDDLRRAGDVVAKDSESRCAVRPFSKQRRWWLTDAGRTKGPLA